MAIKRLSTASIQTGSKSNKLWDQDTQQGAIVPIAHHIASGTATGVDFTNIPQIYQDLLIVQNVRSARTGSTTEQFWQRFNGDSGNTYSYTYLVGNGSGTSSSRLTSQTVTNRFDIPAANATTGIFGASTVHILNYASTSCYKTILLKSANDLNGSGNVNLSAGLWRSYGGIVSVNVATENGSNLIGGSTISVYGIKAGV